MNKFLHAVTFLFICFTSRVIAQPVNDDPCNATPVAIGVSCTFTNYSNAGATASVGIPAPGCANYQGGDVWFRITVPASGAVTVDSKQGTLTDGAMAFYTGANCNSLSLLSCDNNNSNNGLMPLLNASGLTPGSTLYVRFWEPGNNGNGTFDLCATAGPNPTNQDCPNAIPICQNTYSTIISYSGTGSIPNEIKAANSCLASGERNDVWYTFTVNTTGILNFLITPVNLGDDYDWAVYNLTNANCSDIFNTPALEVSCNYSAAPGTTGPNGGGVTNSQPAGGVRYNKTIPVVAGQTYVVNVSNYSASNDGYSIDFGASTANIFDAVPPAISSVSQPIACGSTSLTFNFSENVLCSSVQNADFTLTGPGGPYTVSNWTSTGCATGAVYDNTYTVTVSPPVTASGNYSLCLTNVSGSVIDLCGNVAPPACLQFPISAVTAVVNITDVNCNGGNNGAITINANGGTLPYQYSIDNGVTFQTGNLFNGLTAGAYSVVVLDAIGCTHITNINIAEPNPININAVPADATCGSSNGSINVNANGGVGALQYSSDGGATFQAGNIFNGLPAGNYNIVVKDANGCQSTQVVSVNNTAAPVINAAPFTDVTCNGGTDGSININAGGGTGALQYSIDNGTTFQAGNSFNNLGGGIYNIVVQDASGCQVTTSIVIAEPTPIVLVPASTTSICGLNNGSININANGGTGILQYSIDNGTTFQPANIFNNLPSGNYNIVVKDANGCVAASVINVASEPSPVITGTPAVSVNCSGGNDGSLTINVNGGTGVIQYSIDNGTTFQGGNIFNNLSAGNYTVVIQDANGCMATTIVNIAQPTPVIANANPTISTCGNSNGSINIIANGGTGILEYSIDTGTTWQLGNTFINLSAGNYSVIVNDANGCAVNVPVVVADAAGPQLAAVPFNNVTCFGGNDGSLVVNANGGTGALQYSNDNGATWQAGNSFNNLTVGSYDVVVQDANGCTISTTINIIEPPQIIFNTALVNTTCSNANGSIVINANGGTGALQYSVDNGATFQPANNFINLASGNYTVILQDANGCNATVVVNIADTPGPVINSTPVIDVNCNSGNDGSFTVNAAGGTGVLQYSNDNGATWQGGNSFSNLSAGNYTVMVQDANGCNTSMLVNIAEPSAIVVNPNSVTATCGNANGSINVNANGGTGVLQYSIDNGATFSLVNNFNNLPSGNYDIVVQDANGCVAASVINVADAAGPLITTTPFIDVTCFGGNNGSVIINTNGGTGTLQFSNDNGATWQAGNSFNGLTAGNYDIVVQDANGCVVATAVNIAEPPQIIFNTLPGNTTCSYSNGSILINANGGTGILQYSIDNGVTFSASNNFTNLPAGNYNVIVQDANGCNALAVVALIDAPAPVISATPSVDVLCNGGNNGSIIINANGGTGALQYSIDNGITFQPTNNFANLTAGNYPVLVQDANGCTVAANVIVNEPAAINIIINTVTATCGNSDGSVIINANGGTGVLQYSIDGGVTFQAAGNFNGLPSGNYNVIVQDANNCQAISAAAVNNASAPVISAVNGIDVTCFGGTNGSIDINANGGTGALQYSIDNGTTFFAANNFNNLIAGTYNIVVQDANNCFAAFNIDINEPPVVAFNANALTSTCGNANGSININANGGTGILQYSVDNGITFQAGNNFNNLPSGNYNFIVQDANNCTATGAVNVPSEPSPTIAGTPVVNLTCNGGNNGSIIINANGGTGALLYSIDNGVTFQPANNFLNLTAGNYPVLVQDANGCTVAANAVINEPAAINLNALTNDASCGNSDGSIIINANGGTGALQYSVDNGVTFQVANSFNNLLAANYNIIVMDANGCTAALITAVNNAAAPSITNAPVTDVSCNGGSDGSIIINGTGGTGALQYSIDNGVTFLLTNNFNNLPAGNYNVIVQDVNGCQAVSNVVIAEPAAINVNANPVTATCGNANGSIAINANGGTGTLQYSIDNGTTFVSTSNFSNLTSGNYDIVVQDANGCAATTTSFVNNAPSPVVSSVNSINLTCNNSNDGSIVINANGGTGVLQFSIDNGVTYQGTNSFSNLPAGNYSIIIIDVNNCTAVSNVNLAAPAAIILNSNIVQSTCGASNGGIVINANGGSGAFEYSIDNGATFQPGNIFNGLPAGNYNVIVQDVNGCNAAAIVAVVDAAAPVINATNVADASCYGNNDGTISVNANGGTGALQYSIDGGITFQATGNFNNLPSGNYNVIVQDANGCNIATSAIVNEPPQITFNYNALPSSCGNTDGSATLNAAGGTGILQYSIDNGATFQSGNIFNNLGAGNYDAVIKDATGCTTTGIVSVNNLNGPVISNTATADLTCFGSNNGTINITANGGTGALNYSIDNGIVFQTTNAFNNLPGGAYSIVVMDGNNCLASANVMINEPAQIVFNTVTGNSTCSNSNGTLTVIANGGTGALQYSNNNGTTFQGEINFTNLPAGNYTMVVMDANGCVASSLSVVNNEPSPTIASANTTDVSCNGGTDGTLIIISNGGTGAIQYSIDNGSTFFSNNTFSNLGAGTYDLVIQDANGCTAVTSAGIAEPLPVVFNSNAVTATCSNANGTININANGGTGILQYSIDNGTTFQTGNIFNGLAAGNYNIIVKDANGCIANGIINVPNAPAPVISAIPSVNVSCNGGNNGSLVINANGGTGALRYSIDNGTTFQLSNSFNNLPAGNYAIVVQDVNGCFANSDINIAEPQPIVANTNSNTASCGQDDGSVLVIANGGTGILQYSIDGGITYQASNLFSNLFSGNYSISVKDANGCTAVTAAAVNNANGPAINAAPVVNVSCNGGSNGSININASGGTGVLQYSIDNGATFQPANSFSNLTAGIYDILVQDVNGCNASLTTNVLEPPAIIFNSNSTIATCGNNNGTISISGNGGTGTLQYSIDNGVTFQPASAFNNLAPGNYNIVVQDANGCLANGAAMVNSAPSPVIAATNVVDVTCNGYNNGSITINANGGSGILNYSIDNGATYQTANSFTNLPPGNYNIIVQDTNSCMVADVTNIIQPAAINLNTNFTDVNCFGGNDGTATVIAGGGVSPFNYAWSSGGIDSTVNGLVAGSYAVTVTDANNCTTSVSVSINQPAALAVASLFSDVLCNGGSDGTASVNISGGTSPYSYQWSNNAITPGVTGLTVGNYSVLVTDSHSCVITESFVVNQPPVLTAASSSNAVNCFGGSNGSITIVPAGGTAPYSYQWSPTGGNLSTATNLSSGNYSCIITDANGCSLTMSDSVTSPSSLIVSATPTGVTCNGQNNGTVTGTVNGGTTPYSYLWSTGATTSSVSNLAGGNYTVTVTDNNICLTQKTAVVTEPQPLVLTVAGANTICISQSATISASATGGTPPYTFNWNNGMTGNSQSVSPVITTTYQVAITDANGCIATQQSVTVTVNPPLSVVASDDNAICEGQSTIISANASGGNGGPYTYLWSNNVSSNSTSVSPLQTTTFSVNVTDNCGTPSATDSVKINVNPLPDVVFIPQPAEGCVPLTVRFTDNSITAAGSLYQWSFGDNHVDSVSNPVHTYFETGTYDVNLVVTTPQGCVSSLLMPDAVKVYPVPVAAFTTNPPKASILHPVIDFIDTGSGVDYWSWDFGDALGVSSLKNPNYVYRDTGTYKITLMVENTYGCSDTAYGEIVIEGDFTIYIPNAFTPNSDGQNDYFHVYGIGINDLDMFIFNRWGEQVYYANSMNKPWNGYSSKNNKPCPEDVYVYLVKLVDLSGKNREFTGNVTLVR